MNKPIDPNLQKMKDAVYEILTSTGLDDYDCDPAAAKLAVDQAEYAISNWRAYKSPEDIAEMVYSSPQFWQA